jgi:hypothetical protein
MRKLNHRKVSFPRITNLIIRARIQPGILADIPLLTTVLYSLMYKKIPILLSIREGIHGHESGKVAENICWRD